MALLGPIAVIILIISLIYAQLRWGPDYRKTFSRLVAQKQSSIIYYFIIFFIFLSLFSLFIITSFTTRLNLPTSFTLIYFLSVASQLICVIVPEIGGNKTRIHIVAAGIMSASVFVQVVLLICLVHLSTTSFVICTLSLLLMALIWLVIIFKHNFAKYELALQSIYFVSYLGALMAVYYIR